MTVFTGKHNKTVREAAAEERMFSCLTGCADCCHMPPFPHTWWEANKHRIVRDVVKMSPIIEESIIVMAVEALCPFLGTDLKCTVYSDRPPICKIFGQDKHHPCYHLNPDGTIRTPEQVKKVDNFYKQKNREAEAAIRKMKSNSESPK
jgi:Fe-S-cluster containining protein